LNENEFAEKVQKMKAKLYRTAYLYLVSEQEALDYVDETVYKGLVSLKSLRQPEYFETWLMRILINECVTGLRHRKFSADICELPETAVKEYDRLPLRDAVSRLPKELKDPVILRYFSELTTAETAQTLNIPQGTLATRLRRALKLLRLELSDEEVSYEQK
jgi:RNA polymerase sigma factor (sigma-70 family)